MALDYNGLIEKAHQVAKPYIIQGMKAGIAKVDEEVAQTGTIADNLLWQDVKDSFQKPANA